MSNWNRTTDEDIEMFSLTIEHPDSAPVTILDGCTINTKKYKRIVSWRIEDHDGAFRWSRNAGMTAPAQEIQAYVPWPTRDIGPGCLDSLYLRSSTGGATIVCSLVVTYGDEEARTHP